MKKILTIKGLYKSYNDSSVLTNINIDINKGEIFSLLGPLNSGKTTLLRVVTGMRSKEEGEIFLDGKDITDLPLKDRLIGKLFQNYELFNHLSVKENIEYPVAHKRFGANHHYHDIDKILYLTELDIIQNKKPKQLKLWEKLMVALARSIIINPKLLIIDEPFINLEEKDRTSTFAKIIRVLKELNQTTIFITNNPTEALNVSDRIAILNEENIQQIGHPNDLYEFPNSIFVAEFLGECNIFDTKIESVDNQFYLASSSIGLMKFQSREKFIIGDRVNLMVRPEKIEITTSCKTVRDSSNSFEGFIDEIIYSGHESEFFVKIKNRVDTIKVLHLHEDTREIKWKSNAFIRWDPEDVVVIKE